jgi:hypothetical protein
MVIVHSLSAFVSGICLVLYLQYRFLGSYNRFIGKCGERGTVNQSRDGERLEPKAAPGCGRMGERSGSSKTIVLPISATKLWFLADIITLLRWVSDLAVYSAQGTLLSLPVLISCSGC